MCRILDINLQNVSSDRKSLDGKWDEGLWGLMLSTLVQKLWVRTAKNSLNYNDLLGWFFFAGAFSLLPAEALKLKLLLSGISNHLRTNSHICNQKCIIWGVAKIPLQHFVSPREIIAALWILGCMLIRKPHSLAHRSSYQRPLVMPSKTDIT